MKIDFSEFGRKGKTIVFLHGWQQDKKSFTPLVPFLFKKYHLFLTDLPGFGRSDFPPLSFTSYDYAEAVIDFLDKRQIKNVILVGHSFGGKIAAIVSVKRPQLVSKLVLIANSGIIESKKRVFFARYLPRPIKKIISPIFSSRDYKEAGKLLPIFKTIVKENLNEVFPKIKVPTLIIWGKDDKELSAENGKVINQLIKNSLLLLLEGGHFVFWEFPEIVAREIDSFVQKDDK